MRPARYSFGQSVGVLWEELFGRKFLVLGFFWEEVLSYPSTESSSGLVFKVLGSLGGKPLSVFNYCVDSPPCWVKTYSLAV